MLLQSIWKMGTTCFLEGVRTPKEVSREEIKKVICSTVPTDPNTLEWGPLMGFLKNRIRIRMNITDQNASTQLLDACRTFIYPEEDMPEVEGLLRALERACSRARLSFRLEKGPKEIQPGFVGFFAPYLIHLPFKKAKLYMAIAPGEFQWIMNNATKENPPLANQLAVFKRELLKESREWVRRGNR